jgi:phosphoribosylamine---glycine ligase
MKVLVIGSGGREHAIVWKLRQSPRIKKLYCAPGNGGISADAECVAVDVKSVDSLVQLASQLNPDLTVVGPELPLTLGVVDEFQKRGWPVFGATQAAAQLESSKSFAKEFMQRHRIPTAKYSVVTHKEEIPDALKLFHTPIVVKADGLAAGKGVVIAQSKEEAQRTAEDMLSGKMLGDAGARVVFEECLQGEELSFLVMSDGQRVVPLVATQDHKRVFDNDEGPNTGGMGAYSPAPVMTPEMSQRALDEIVLPTIRAMRDMGAPYKGVLYAGLMITPDGPKLIEYNVRFGDPECQVLMLRLVSDLVPALMAARDGMLKNFDLRWVPDVALTVVMAARGYPGHYEKGSVIAGLNEAEKVDEVEIFHAGTKDERGHIVANGGRVLNVSALGKTVSEARERAYWAIDRIRWPDGFCRRDIGYQAIAREKETS